MPRLSRRQKLLRVLKRKLLKPIVYAIGLSFFLYLVIGNVVLQQRVVRQQSPRFLITRISDEFDETEFMHLLLTVQEILKVQDEPDELIAFANGPFPGKCPKLLAQQLRAMNWEPQAFLVRVKKIFKLYDVYDRILRLDETIAFLTEEVNEGRLPTEVITQLKVLKDEREAIIGKELSQQEFNFVRDYQGLILKIKR